MEQLIQQGFDYVTADRRKRRGTSEIRVKPTKLRTTWSHQL
jgi:hypothetical protein